MKNNLKFLICDDDPDLLETLQLIVSDLFPSSDIKSCNNGLSAIKLIDSYDFDVIVSDKEMTGEENTGIHTYQHIRNKKDTFFILLSGSIKSEEIYEYRNDTNFQAIDKPVTSKFLEDQITQYFNNKDT